MTESILGKAGNKNGKSDLARPPAQPPKCPECTSQRVWKDGIRYTRHGDVQRYLCRNCGYRFSKNGLKSTTIVVAIRYNGKTLPICDACWTEISEADYEWG